MDDFLQGAWRLWERASEGVWPQSGAAPASLNGLHKTGDSGRVQLSRLTVDHWTKAAEIWQDTHSSVCVRFRQIRD